MGKIHDKRYPKKGNDTLRPLPSIVLIDFDGTLVDTMKPLWNCFKQFLGKYGVRASKTDFNKLTGPSITEIVSFLKAKYKLVPSHKVLEKEYRALIEDAYEHDLQLFPHVVSVLKALKKNDFKIAIVTAAPKKLVKRILESNQIDNLIDAIITPNSKEPAKPDPALYLKALRKFRIRADEAVAVEDSLNGCTSSVNAGIFTILLTHNKKNESYEPKAGLAVVLTLNGWKAVQKYLLPERYNR